MKITKSNTPQLLAKMKASGVLISCRSFNSGGKGGQHGNRSDNAIELVVEWNLDGDPFRVTATAALKSQHDSRCAALRVAASRLLSEVKRRSTPQRARGGMGFGDSASSRVRTYHQPDNRVSDSSGFDASYKQTVGRGRLDDLIDRRRLALEVEAMR